MQHAQTQSQNGYAQSPSRTPVSRFWRPAALAGALLTSVQFVPTAWELYRMRYDSDYQDVRSLAVAQHQLALTDRNLACFADMQRKKTQVNDGLEIEYGACPNDNVYIGVYLKNKSGYARWLEPGRKEQGASLSMFIPPAFAGVTRPYGEGNLTRNVVPAQTTLTTVCQDWQNARRTKVVRISDEGDKCVFERINVLSGVIEVRETVPCDMKCDAAAKQFN